MLAHECPAVIKPEVTHVSPENVTLKPMTGENMCNKKSFRTVVHLFTGSSGKLYVL